MAPFRGIEVFLWFTHRRHPIVSLILWVAFPCVCHSFRGHTSTPPHITHTPTAQHTSHGFGGPLHTTHSLSHAHSTLHACVHRTSTPLRTLYSPFVHTTHPSTTSSFLRGAPRGQVLGEGIVIAETHVYTHVHTYYKEDDDEKKKRKRKGGKNQIHDWIVILSKGKHIRRILPSHKEDMHMSSDHKWSESRSRRREVIRRNVFRVTKLHLETNSNKYYRIVRQQIGLNGDVTPA